MNFCESCKRYESSFKCLICNTEFCYHCGKVHLSIHKPLGTTKQKSGVTNG